MHKRDLRSRCGSNKASTTAACVDYSLKYTKRRPPASQTTSRRASVTCAQSAPPPAHALDADCQKFYVPRLPSQPHGAVGASTGAAVHRLALGGDSVVHRGPRVPQPRRGPAVRSRLNRAGVWTCPLSLVCSLVRPSASYRSMIGSSPRLYPMHRGSGRS